MRDNFLDLVLKRLAKRYGYDVHTQLGHESRADLFAAVLLSPQCTDAQVNKATRVLFKRFRTFNDYAAADLATLRHYLKGVNFYRTKAKHLKESAKIIVTKHSGRLPRSLRELLELPGVGRKVANVVLNEAFGIDEGIAVDTHVAVTARRLHLSRSKDPDKIEQDLLERVPKERWGMVSNLLIELGRDTCTARNRQCHRCSLKDVCPSSLVA